MCVWEGGGARGRVLSCRVPGLWLRQSTLPAEERAKVATGAVVEHQVKVSRGLKLASGTEGNDERVRALPQDGQLLRSSSGHRRSSVGRNQEGVKTERGTEQETKRQGSQGRQGRQNRESRVRDGRVGSDDEYSLPARGFPSRVYHCDANDVGVFVCCVRIRKAMRVALEGRISKHGRRRAFSLPVLRAIFTERSTRGKVLSLARAGGGGERGERQSTHPSKRNTSAVQKRIRNHSTTICMEPSLCKIYGKFLPTKRTREKTKGTIGRSRFRCAAQAPSP